MSLVGDRVEYRFSPEEARASACDFDLKRLPPDFIDDPFPYYRALREHDPVHRMPDGAYLITRWRDCDAVADKAHGFLRPQPSQARASCQATLICGPLIDGAHPRHLPRR